MNYDNTKTYFENDFGKSFANYFNMNYHYNALCSNLDPQMRFDLLSKSLFIDIFINRN